MKPKIYIKKNQSYLRIIDECSATRNDGLIKLINKNCACLSLKLDGKSPRYLIGEIVALGGNFYGETTYKDCLPPLYASKGAGGRGFEGYASFKSVEDAIKYLEQYFDVIKCWVGDFKKIKAIKSDSIIKPKIKPHAIQSFSLSELIKNCIPESTVKIKLNRFNQFYTSLTDAFRKDGMLHTIDGIDAAPKNVSPKSKNWPKEPGVYVVRKKQKESEAFEIIYIGKSGVVRKHEDEISSQLDERLSRWDPYCFLPDGFYYNYKRESKKPRYSNSYQGSIPVNEYQIDCFRLNKKCRSAPAFLEAMILEIYFETHDDRLPIANNEF
jgi:hypothetical protein